MWLFIYLYICLPIYLHQVVNRNARIVLLGINVPSPLKQSLRYVPMARTQLDLKVFVHLVLQERPVIFLVRVQTRRSKDTALYFTVLYLMK